MYADPALGNPHQIDDFARASGQGNFFDTVAGERWLYRIDDDIFDTTLETRNPVYAVWLVRYRAPVPGPLFGDSIENRPTDFVGER